MTELFPVDPANPALSADQMRSILVDAWGVDGELTSLGSMQDQNFRVSRQDGSQAVAKIAGLHTLSDSVELQNAAMRHVAARRNGFISPEPIDSRDGSGSVDAAGHRIRLLTWVEGIPLSERGYLGPADLYQLGALAGRVSLALDGLDHPALRSSNAWDVRVAARVLAESRAHLPAAWAPYLDGAIAAFEAVGVDAALPEAIVHGDLTPVNAVCLPNDELRSPPVGVLDFGDIMHTWRIGDVAACAVGAVEHPGTGDALDAVLAVLQGYHETIPLSEAEIVAFWPLVGVRAAVSAAMSRRQLARNAENEYAEQSVESGVRAMRRLAAIPPALALAAARERVGLTPVPAAPAILGWLRAQSASDVVPGLSTANVVVTDLSVDNPAFAYGEWTDPAEVRRLLSGSPVTVTRWGERRLVGNSDPALEPEPTLQLGIDLIAAEGVLVSAPLAGTVHALDRDAANGSVVVDVGADGGRLLLRLSGIAVDNELTMGAPIRAGARVGTVAAGSGWLPSRVHVQFMLADDLPDRGHATHHGAWLALCPDPSVLLPVDAAVCSTDSEVLRREREAVVARPQHLYYDQPPQIVRGWRHHLYDADGRCYLDMINNIAAVGHSHPRVTEAAVRQFRRLNTNSRFLYDSMTRYSERIVELLPPELDTVFLVNSGSEAADLALQLAQRFTARRDVVALAGAYHGWTGSVIDISTSPMDRPNWRAELLGWVHVADQPDTFRGSHGNDAEGYRRSVRAACAAADAGVAAFISEPLLGNQGAVELPAGYLRGVYEDVRAVGGLCIADEVQVGMARTGETFWAFEHEGAVPDIVYTAKATGNGHPLGVVVCRREIADRFDGQTAYFSSTGGGPVSCEIGLAVLDVIRDEGLQENARVIGAHLKGRLGELAAAHPLIGAVHGRGLYLGVDLVLDRERRTPARFEALAISERLRSLGVIMQPTGDAFNVLKVKPPLCLDRSAADYFVGALGQVLTEFT